MDALSSLVLTPGRSAVMEGNESEGVAEPCTDVRAVDAWGRATSESELCLSTGLLSNTMLSDGMSETSLLGVARILREENDSNSIELVTTPMSSLLSRISCSLDIG